MVKSSATQTEAKDVPVRRPRLSARKRALFVAGAMLVAMLAVGGLEGTLRLFGLGGYAPVLQVAGDTPHGRVVVSNASGAASYFFANKSRPGGIAESTFYQPKPAGTFRIMWFGESAAKGFPEPPCLAATAFLEAMLKNVWPDRQVEVINLACTAIASFPVRGILEEAVAFEPDLVIVYCGNNEFFGAYGVASLHRSGDSVTAMRFQRWMRSLALTQAFDKLTATASAGPEMTLMERMVADARIEPTDPRRDAAARNLYDNLTAMVRLCRDRNVPIMVCNSPVNERDLAPLGNSDLARRTYESGVAFAAEGKDAAAADAFQKAVDLDIMPWRATSRNNDAIRRAATENGALFCDLVAAFRAESPHGAIGWELMDDHVHPSLRGQDLIARTVVKTLTSATGLLHVDKSKFDSLPGWEEIATTLGDCDYTRYAVAHTVRVINNIPFYKASNPVALARYGKIIADLEYAMSPEVLKAAHDWQKPESHGGGTQRPITGMVARAKIRENNYAEAERLSEVAVRCVPPYSSWSLEFTYFMLICRERVVGKLSDADLVTAREAIDRGRFLLSHGNVETGLTERYIGRLHQLRGEWAEAIPYLLHARAKLGGSDLVAVDQALVESYLRGGDRATAEKIITAGEADSEFGALYRKMRAMYLAGPAPAARP